MLVPYTRLNPPRQAHERVGPGATQKRMLEVNVFSCLFVDIHFIVGYS